VTAVARALPSGIVDLTDPDSFVAGVPHETFRRLRAEAPVAWHPERDGPGFWAVTKWADVRAVSLDQATYSSWQGGIMLREMAHERVEAQREMLIAMEPRRHAKHRRLVAGTFTPKVIRALEPRLRALVGRLLDGVAPRGECDFVTDVAAELPVIAICELLGVPVEDRARIVGWSNAMVGMDDPEYADDPETGQLAAMQLAMYASELAERRRAEPRDDIVTILQNAEVDGERLSEVDFIAFFVLLTIAGNETTRNQTSHTLRLLFEHPKELAKLLDCPTLLNSAIEEALRFSPPVMYFRRTAKSASTIRGVDIPDGAFVCVYYPSANRDEDVFPDPDTFDITRNPNEHLAFGDGEHFCLGVHLARLELQIAYKYLLPRIQEIELAGPVERLHSSLVGGVKRLPIRYKLKRP